MSNDLAEANQGGGLAIPAELAAAFGGIESNIKLGDPTPHMTIKGKVWGMVREGNEQKLLTKVDGESVPMPTVKVVILNQVQKRSHTFYEGAYVEGSNSQPNCWSVDGDTPDSDVSKPESSKCEGCPQSIKGSKINDSGDAVAACSTSKRICVVPSTKPDFTALLLKLPVTSLWQQDPSETAQGWYPFDDYLKFLKSNNVPHTAYVETTMKFDSNVAYPKVLFKYSGFLTGDVATVIAPRIESDEVMDVLGIGKKAAEAEAKRPTSTQAAEPLEEEVKEEPVKVATVVEDDDSGFGGEVEETALKKAAPKKKAAKKKKAAPKEEVVATVDDDDGLSDAMSNWED